MPLKQLIIVYLLVVNAVSFIAYGIDKWKARHSRWRTPEAVLLMLAVIGGSIGAYLGMQLWHHKTQHNKFRFGIPIILIVQIAAALLLLHDLQ